MTLRCQVDSGSATHLHPTRVTRPISGPPSHAGISQKVLGCNVYTGQSGMGVKSSDLNDGRTRPYLSARFFGSRSGKIRSRWVPVGNG